MPSPKRPTKEVKAVLSSADYYEPLLRARFVRAMKKLQKETSINQLALAIPHLKRTQHQVVDRKAIEAALEPLRKVIRDAYMRGGKLGAAHLKALING